MTLTNAGSKTKSANSVTDKTPTESVQSKIKREKLMETRKREKVINDADSGD